MARVLLRVAGVLGSRDVLPEAGVRAGAPGSLCSLQVDVATISPRSTSLHSVGQMMQMSFSVDFRYQRKGRGRWDGLRHGHKQVRNSR